MDCDRASCWLVASVADIIYMLISRDSFKPQLHFMIPLNILLTNSLLLRSALVQSFMECSPCPVYDPQLMHWPQNVISPKHCRTRISAPMTGRQFTELFYCSKHAPVASSAERKQGFPQLVPLQEKHWHLEKVVLMDVNHPELLKFWWTWKSLWRIKGRARWCNGFEKIKYKWNEKGYNSFQKEMSTLSG